MRRYFRRGTQQMIWIRKLEFPLGSLDEPVLSYVHREHKQNAPYRDPLDAIRFLFKHNFGQNR